MLSLSLWRDSIHAPEATMRHLQKSLAAAAAVLLLAAPVHADTVQFLDYAHGSVGVTFDLTGTGSIEGTTRAGGFLTKLNGVDPVFTTYCVDLYQYIAFNHAVYTYGNVPASGHLFRNSSAAVDLARLYSSGHVTNSPLTEAAFQIAVWEIAYETSGTYKLDYGDARFGANSVAALVLATDWLDHLGTGNGYSVRVLESAFNQDQIFATRVPEPGTFALAFAAFAAMVGVRRHQARPRCC
jgi:hypothetical protein